jgi:hypothetical protein
LMFSLLLLLFPFAPDQPFAPRRPEGAVGRV